MARKPGLWPFLPERRNGFFFPIARHLQKNRRESYENTDRYARMSYNWSIYGAGEQMPHSDELFLVGGDIQIDAYENLWG